MLTLVVGSNFATFEQSGQHADRVGRIVELHANSREEIEEVAAGDIAAAVGLKETYTGDTLTDMTNPIVLEALDFPDPVIHVAVEQENNIKPMIPPGGNLTDFFGYCIETPGLFFTEEQRPAHTKRDGRK